MSRARIDAALRSGLASKSRPRGWDDAQEATYFADALALCEKAAPANVTDAWLGQLKERLMLTKGRTYPEMHALKVAFGQAASQARKAEPARSELSATERTFRINCQRVCDGEPVNEAFLFGADADRGLREERMTYPALSRYQKISYRARVAMYGEDRAYAWVAERNQVAADRLRAEYVEAQKAKETEGDTEEGFQ